MHSVSVCVRFTLPLLLAGCANMDVVRVTNPNQPGIRYWRPSLYLVLQKTRGEKLETCEVKTLTLPDKTEEYAITVTPGMGTAEIAPTLHEGWRLDTLSAKLDSKASENLNALASLLKATAPGGLVAPPDVRTADRGGEKQREPECSGVYKVLYNPQTGEFAGFRRVLL